MQCFRGKKISVRSLTLKQPANSQGAKKGLRTMDLTERFKDALTFTFDLHRTQRRKGTETPYLGHLLTVAGIVFDYGGSEDEAIAALLHDAVEDQGGSETLEEIRRRFGENVAGIVDGCSDTDQHPKPPWRGRKEEYLNHLPHADPSVILVSAADKLHNLRSFVKDYRVQGEALWGCFKGGREGTLWYHRELIKAYRRVCDLPLIDAVERELAELERIIE